PGTRHTAHPRLTAEFALGAHLAGHSRHLVGERRQLVDKTVDGTADLQELPAQRMRRTVGPLGSKIHALLQITLRNRGEHPPHLGGPLGAGPRALRTHGCSTRRCTRLHRVPPGGSYDDVPWLLPAQGIPSLSP